MNHNEEVPDFLGGPGDMSRRGQENLWQSRNVLPDPDSKALAINYYFEGLPADVIALRKEQIAAVACIRNYSWLALSDSFPQQLIDECVALFNQRVAARRDYLLDVCNTIKDWTL